jgi:hypothetical protein
MSPAILQQMQAARLPLQDSLRHWRVFHPDPSIHVIHVLSAIIG